MIISTVSEAYQLSVRVNYSMKGAYTLIIKIQYPVELQIKSLGRITFQDGIWVYIGSAMGSGSTNLENRIKRHFSSAKTVHWHIDYLLCNDVNLLKAFWAESATSIECDIAQELHSKNDFHVGPSKFGSSDCQRGCEAHIFRFSDYSRIDGVIEEVFKKTGYQPSITTDGNL